MDGCHHQVRILNGVPVGVMMPTPLASCIDGTKQRQNGASSDQVRRQRPESQRNGEIALQEIRSKKKLEDAQLLATDDAH